MHIRNEKDVVVGSRITSASGESGSALLIVLTALAIALPLGVGFVYHILSAKTAATTLHNRARARQTATSGLMQAIALIRATYDPGDGVDDGHDRFPATRPAKPFYTPVAGSYAGRSYLCSQSTDKAEIATLLAVRMASLDFIPGAIMDMDSEATPITDDRGFLHVVANGKVIGRYAFMIVDESGKLDPNSVATLDTSEDSGSVTRAGASVREICLQDTGLANHNSYIVTGGHRFHSLRQMANELAPSDFGSKVIRVLHPYGVHQETYWNDNDNDGGYDDGEEYDRLNVTTAADMTLAKLYKAFVAPNDPDSALPDLGDTNDANDCPWLKQLATDGVAGSGADRRRIAGQVAVNMIDYQDADSASTAAWITTGGALTLTNPGAANTEIALQGRENQYGISEVSIQLVVTVGGGLITKPLTIDVYVKGEIFYPAAENQALGSESLNLTFTVKAWALLAGEQTFFNGVTFNIPMAATANEEGGTLHYSSAWHLAGTHTKAGFVTAAGYTITNLQIDAVSCSDGVTTHDSMPSQPSSSYVWNWSSSPLILASQTFYATIEAFDPQNNGQDEATPVPAFGNLWRARPSGSDVLLTSASLVGIGELTRTGTTPGSGLAAIHDYGDVVVQNAAFTRVGELGRVGSYWPGRSLRLWAAASGDESGVDAHILDMLKAHDGSLARDKVPINSMNSDVLTALFSGAVATDTDAAVNAVLAARSSGRTFANIGDFFRVHGISGTDKGLDETEEMAAVKLAELITVRRNYFTVVVVGQSVEDSGGQYVYKDLNGDGDTYDVGETIITSYGVYDPYGDKIHATAQLLAVVHRDPISNRTRIEHLETIR